MSRFVQGLDFFVSPEVNTGIPLGKFVFSFSSGTVCCPVLFYDLVLVEFKQMVNTNSIILLSD
jgi:hypothetical protein